MNRLSKLLIILIVLAMFVGCFTACDLLNPKSEEEKVETPAGDEVKDDEGQKEEDKKEEPEIEFIDYASQVKFDPNSGRKWAKVKVKSYIDGDTTHFETIDGTDIDGVDYVKARYLSINTPESTGVIEPWGKKASNYTKGQLMKATEIIIESDTDKWDLDSTGSRYLLWVWYKTAEDKDFRNLNLEILQQGLAYGSGVSSNVYGNIGAKALEQAVALKLHVFDRTTKDPDFYYGGAIELTLKEIKASIVWNPETQKYESKYDGKLVKFEAVVAKQVGPTIYVEEYDADNDMYFGMQIFAGYSYSRMSDFILGNRVSIVGKVSYYENGDTYQISSLECDILDPNWEGGCRVLSTGNSASYREIDLRTLLDGSITLDVIEEKEDDNGEIIEIATKRQFDYAELAHYSTATIKNLVVQSVRATESDTSSDGALTITCKDEYGNIFKIRTASRLVKEVDGQSVAVTESDFPAGTIISAKGVIDFYMGSYQLKVFAYSDLTFG